ncbi:MAG: fatty acid desaturase [Pseudomonadota bacterium]
MSASDLPFTTQDLRAAIPDRCFQPSMARSFAYLVFDLTIIAALYLVLSQTSAWYIEWPVIFLIGTMLWSLFVIGHDAGHGSFSSNRSVNTIVGILVHGAILVPYRGWQRSHALHHMKTGTFARKRCFARLAKAKTLCFGRLFSGQAYS